MSFIVFAASLFYSSRAGYTGGHVIFLQIGAAFEKDNHKNVEMGFAVVSRIKRYIRRKV